MPWPARSPDVNPIENIWGVLKKRVMKRRPKDLENLEDNILDEVQDFPTRIVSNTFETIYERIHMLSDNRGEALPF